MCRLAGSREGATVTLNEFREDRSQFPRNSSPGQSGPPRGLRYATHDFKLVVIQSPGENMDAARPKRSAS